MKTLRCLAGALLLCGAAVQAQTSYFNQGFLRQPSAEADRAYLGIGTNGGSGTVTNFSMDNFSPLFNATVTSPTLNPHLSLTPIAQAAHTFYAAPLAGGTPTFRTIDASDLPGGGGTATNLTDLPLTNLTAFQNSSNYFIDFAFPSAVLTSATNVITFNYSTNWGLANTSRVCNILVPATNFGRIVTFANAATNWHIMPMVYFIPLGYNARFFATQWGQGETNVTISPYIESKITTSNTTASFNPTNVFPNSGGLGTKLWLDASTKAWQDEYLTVPTIEGSVVRGWTDLSGFVPAVTNMITTELNTFYHTPMLGPLNVPSMRIYPGQSGAFCWLQSPSYTAITAPIWGFIMYYGRSGGVVVDANAGTRFAINPAEMGQVSSFFCSAGIQYTAAKTVNWTLVACLGNGASSVMRTNGVQAVSGNAGTPSPSQWMIFGDNTKAVQVGEYHVAEILILATNLSNTQLTNVESYFYRKYPFFNPPTVQ